MLLNLFLFVCKREEESLIIPVIIELRKMAVLHDLHTHTHINA